MKAILTLVAMLAGSAAAADVPPFMLADSPTRVQSVGSRYVVTATDGTTRTWYRSGTSWYDGRGTRFDATSNGWRERGRAARWKATADGWRGPDGQHVAQGPVAIRAGTATFTRVHDGVRRLH